MLSAKSAREQSAVGAVASVLKDLEKSIRAAIQKGKIQIHKTGNVPPEVITELETAGYKVEKQTTGIKVSW